ncbi:hypothetical protein [Bradyrhizobium cenepequi]|uniref:hypothetical protein n=1 Tax=Bradyrhizobium cenepequi TaxID=2821403 RepID=UPI001CE2E93B|nr:hypothetical protein [Bradyrhizobium cenepequi]MCA6109556.1 hypothetical protein [Bradyrhizobium cenepequi]
MGIGRWSFQGFGAKLILLTVLTIAGFAGWLMLPNRSDADNKSVAVASPPSASPQDVVWLEKPAAPTEQQAAAPADDAVGDEAPTASTNEPFTVERSPIDGLKISRQFWRRGGLGSKALVTLTLRNANHYPVKDIEIACAFARADGTHLTDRRRVISDTINMKSRKTYAGVLVGFVNINANKAKCSVVTAAPSVSVPKK